MTVKIIPLHEQIEAIYLARHYGSGELAHGHARQIDDDGNENIWFIFGATPKSYLHLSPGHLPTTNKNA